MSLVRQRHSLIVGAIVVAEVVLKSGGECAGTQQIQLKDDILKLCRKELSQQNSGRETFCPKTCVRRHRQAGASPWLTAGRAQCPRHRRQPRPRPRHRQKTRRGRLFGDCRGAKAERGSDRRHDRSRQPPSAARSTLSLSTSARSTKFPACCAGCGNEFGSFFGLVNNAALGRDGVLATALRMTLAASPAAITTASTSLPRLAEPMRRVPRLAAGWSAGGPSRQARSAPAMLQVGCRSPATRSGHTNPPAGRQSSSRGRYQ